MANCDMEAVVEQEQKKLRRNATSRCQSTAASVPEIFRTGKIGASKITVQIDAPVGVVPSCYDGLDQRGHCSGVREDVGKGSLSLSRSHYLFCRSV